MWCSTRINTRANSVFIYIIDLPSVTGYFNLRLFADDSNITMGVDPGGDGGGGGGYIPPPQYFRWGGGMACTIIPPPQ